MVGVVHRCHRRLCLWDDGDATLAPSDVDEEGESESLGRPARLEGALAQRNEPERLAEIHETWGGLGQWTAFRWGASRTLLAQWAAKDARALHEWAMTLPAESRLPVAQVLFEHWMQDDPLRALSKLSESFPEAVNGVFADDGFPMPYLPEATLSDFLAWVDAVPEAYRARVLL